jgi:hypothetical protein
LVLQQPLRVGGLALASALATATVAVVTFVVSNLVLAVVAGIGLTGGVVPESADAAGSADAVQGLLVSAEPEKDRAGRGRDCRSRTHLILQRTGKHVRCAQRPGSAGTSRP